VKLLKERLEETGKNLKKAQEEYNRIEKDVIALKKAKGEFEETIEKARGTARDAHIKVRAEYWEEHRKIVMEAGKGEYGVKLQQARRAFARQLIAINKARENFKVSDNFLNWRFKNVESFPANITIRRWAKPPHVTFILPEGITPTKQTVSRVSAVQGQTGFVSNVGSRTTQARVRLAGVHRAPEARPLKLLEEMQQQKQQEGKQRLANQPPVIKQSSKGQIKVVPIAEGSKKAPTILANVRSKIKKPVVPARGVAKATATATQHQSSTFKKKTREMRNAHKPRIL
jgi:hypothetical protein